MLDKLKSLSAIVLLLCLFLPLSQCTQEARPDKPNSEATVTIVTPLHSLNSGGLSLKNIITPLLFILPFLLMLIHHLRNDVQLKLTGRPADFTWFLFLFEILSSIGLAILLAVYFYFGKPLMGLYVSFSTLAVYFVALIASLFNRH